MSRPLPRRSPRKGKNKELSSDESSVSEEMEKQCSHDPPPENLVYTAMTAMEFAVNHSLSEKSRKEVAYFNGRYKALSRRSPSEIDSAVKAFKKIVPW